MQTYSSCIEFPCLRLFFATCAAKGYIVGFGDVNNAYQQSPPPSVDFFIEIDNTVEDWYFRRFGIRLNRFKEVIPLLRALQGHPEAGVLWERMITDILINKMGFKNTTHEHNLYVGVSTIMKSSSVVKLMILRPDPLLWLVTNISSTFYENTLLPNSMLWE